MSNDHTLVLSSVTATIHAPIEKVDIPDWLFNLPDAKCQRRQRVHRQARLRPPIASLIGDLPPIASIAIGTPEKAFVLALRRSEDDHGPLLNLFSILTILTVETEMNREPQWMTLPPTPVLGQPGAGVGKRLSGDRHRQPRAWAEFT